MKIQLGYQRLFSMLALSFLLTYCAFPQRQKGNITVTVYTDGSSQDVDVPAGSTVRETFENIGITINSLDRSDPPLFTVLSNGAEIYLIRVEEEYIVEMSILPYETQVLRNESLPEGESRLIQPGVNGVQETTFRVILENGIEISRGQVKTITVEPPTPEVVMVGSQSPFITMPIPGTLAYLSAGNAWIMEENTGIRRPVVTTGDLDGRVFSLSPESNWLLYTRSDESEDVINTLWVSRFDTEEPIHIDLKVTNVIHFADWVPGAINGVVFSTAEAISSPPGWQANNDLLFLNFSSDGWVSRPRTTIQENTGGVYGWWGIDYSYSPNGERLAYAGSDEIGLVDINNGTLFPLFDFIPLQTRSDWAWLPEISWSPDGSYIYFVYHSPQEGLSSSEESPLFDLAVFPLVGGVPVSLISEVGMFAYPLPSPIRQLPNGEKSYQVAYLQALLPTQSRTSGYQLMLVDRDGSNPALVFPPLGNPGLSPHRYLWAPEMGEGEAYPLIALIYDGDLWLIDVDSGSAQQLTGDGLITTIDWK